MKFLANPWTMRLRSLARSLGLTRLAGALISRQGKRERHARAAYRRHQPAAAALDLGAGEILLTAENEQEYMRALAFTRDRSLIEALISRLAQGASFWDIGANIGAYSCTLGKFLKQRSGHVVAFEPDPWCGQRLLKNLALNELSNASVHRLALSDTEGEMKFAPDPKATTGGHLTPVASGGGQDLISVQVTTGDRALKRWELAVPTVIKVDTEGYEYEVLSGLRETLEHPRCRFVLVEVHFARLEGRGMTDAPAQIEALLRDRGFSDLRWIDFSHLAATKPG